jgi:hypothetical protein
VSRPHPAVLRLAEALIIAGVAAGVVALIARVADANDLLLRFLEGSALLLAAAAYLAHLLSHRPTRSELILRSGLVTAFVLWAIVQLFPTSPAAALLNDAAIVLFIADLALVLAPWRLDEQ